ncbi:rhomboid family intramembrane serine protease [Nakamurella endophytica]|uniref:Rhomboid family intramembrane serine protease n=1 Tax=Nakamurella endophytica TaxID=1748367 RepID=A0A917T1S4_9ACTN|nr:rhomboid family intramembrane serine protease [Nakamurella endophytica]GGM07252.1 rhomboid family intramembrane serine protease [Nakamurella endophytica]
MTMPTLPTGPATPARRGSMLLPAAVRPAAVTVGVLAVVLVLVQTANSVTGYWLDAHLGIQARTVAGLDGVLAAPLLHASWQHLLSNIVPLVIFGFLVMVGGVRQFVAVTVLVWLVSGLGVWLVGPAHAVTVGASGLVFGWLAYLVSRGIFTRTLSQILVGVLLLAIWGGIFWTGIVHVVLTPGSSGVSWQGHLFGAIGGVLAAFLVARADGPRRRRAAAVGGAGGSDRFGTAVPPGLPRS